MRIILVFSWMQSFQRIVDWIRSESKTTFKQITSLKLIMKFNLEKLASFANKEVFRCLTA